MIRSSVLNFSRNNYALAITGSIIVGISLLSIFYFGSIAIKDASTGNINEPNGLPMTRFGPFSAYHLEYSSVFAFIFGAALLCFGVFGTTSRSTSNKHRTH
jgi:hypothetical protein